MAEQQSRGFREHRCFVLDTNVLLHDPHALFAFKGVVVVIPFVVLEELDTFKREAGDKGHSAREVIRTLDELRSRGKLHDGVPLNQNTDGSILKVIPTPSDVKLLCSCADSVDNSIIATIQWLIEQGNTVTFITKDINARVKSDSLGIDAEDYTKGKVSEETYYKGWLSIPIPAKILRDLSSARVSAFIGDTKIHPNEFVELASENNPENYRLFRLLSTGQYQEVVDPRLSWDFHARNIQQRMALDLLMDDQVKMVSLLGPAGTGKTFLALLAGLEKVAKEKAYRRFLISRPLVALGADIGYLPGDVQEKLHNWMMPVHDNLEFIFSSKSNEQPSQQGRRKKGADAEMAQEGRDEHKHKHKRRHHGHEQQIYTPSHHFSDTERLQRLGIISIEAITYMRGRSIPKQFIFIDEVQNLTPHEVKTIVSRVGEGSKIVLAGDPYQIDSPYLDFTTNGLTVTTEKFKDQQIFGTVFLNKSERSELAKLAAEIL